MKYRYYIANTFDGMVEATNDPQKAADFAASEDFYVIDAQEGLMLTSDGESIPAKNIDG